MISGFKSIAEVQTYNFVYCLKFSRIYINKTKFLKLNHRAPNPEL
jgi:hypothetical protein